MRHEQEEVKDNIYKSPQEKLQDALFSMATRFSWVSTVVGTFASYLLSLGLRFDFDINSKLTWGFTWLPLVVLALLRAGFYEYMGIHKTLWRHVSSVEVTKIVKAHAYSSIVFGAALSLLRPDSFPRSFIFIELFVSLLLSVGARFIARAWYQETGFGLASKAVELKKVVVLGAGNSGHILVKSLLTQKRFAYNPVAVLDDNPLLHNTLVHGVPVVGELAKLKKALEEYPEIAGVIVAIPSLSQPKLREIERVCGEFHLPVKHIQSFDELACQELIEPKPKRTIEEVLNREIEIQHEEDIYQALSGKRILITGAGGSIGSELVRQVLSFGPAKVVLLDQSEFNLYSIQQELRTQENAEKINGVQSGSFVQLGGESTKKVYALASIVNKERLEKIFDEHRPEVVFHAAAYKHVPLLEANCYEAFLNNIVGTRNLLEVAQDYGAQRFVLISTDKAVDPSSVMGSTKRVTEMMVGDPDGLLDWRKSIGAELLAAHAKRRIQMNTAVVRFGNVINSSGSVIPLFKKQILEGRPMTVTHPEMDRYFMSIREAVRLVLTAGTLGDRGEIYLLDMGKPIKIVEVAKKLRALYGRRDLPIVFTGLREGEKLSEQLVSVTEEVSPARFKKVSVVHPLVRPLRNVFEWAQDLHNELSELEDADIGTRIRNYVLGVERGEHTAHEVEFKVVGQSSAANN